MGYTPATVFAALPDGLTPLALFDAEFDAISIALSNGTIPPVIAAANTIWAGPAAGGPGAPSFRGLVTADLPGGVTGTGQVVLADSPTLITPNLGTPTAANLANATGLPLASGVTGVLPIANGGTGATSAGAARLGLVLPTYVANLAAIGALNPTQDALAYDQESAYANWFKFLAGNQSAIVTADPLHLYSYPPASDPTGASGVWVQPQAQTTTAFWTDLSPGALITRIANRLFVGAATINDGALTNVQSDWLTQAGFGWLTDASNLSVGSTIGNIGVLGFSRSSDIGHATTALGVASVVFHNSSYGAPNGGWGFYGDVRRYAGAGGFTQGAELDISNFDAVVDITPHNIYGNGNAQFNLLLGANGFLKSTDPIPNNISSAIVVVGGDNVSGVQYPKFEKFITIKDTALDTTNGPGIVMALPADSGLFWYNQYDQQTAAIYSTITGDINSTRIIFSDTGFTIGNYGSAILVTVPPVSSPANYLQLQAAATAAPVQINALGSDANIDFWLQPKGTGTGKLLNGAASSSVVMWNNTGLGFNNTVPIAKPTVSGSKGGNAALASLMTALSSYGLVTDSTT